MNQKNDHLQFYISHFFQWWYYELSTIIPDWLKSTNKRPIPYIAFSYHENKLTITKKNSINEEPEIQEFHTLENFEFHSQEFIKRLKKKNKANIFGLRLRPKQYFLRKEELPLETRFEIEKILSLNLENTTPFKHDQIYSDYIISKENKNKLHIQQIIAKRDKVNSLIENFEKQNIKISFVDAIGDEPSSPYNINLIAENDISNNKSLYKKTAYMFLSLILILSTTFTYLLFEKQSLAISALNQKIKIAKQKAQKVQARIKSSQNLERKIQSLNIKKHKVIPIVRLWEEIAKKLPDDSWVNDMQVKQGEIIITGYTKNAEKLLKTLDNSKLFHKISFISPVIMDPTQKRERYRLKLLTKPAQFSELKR